MGSEMCIRDRCVAASKTTIAVAVLLTKAILRVVAAKALVTKASASVRLSSLLLHLHRAWHKAGSSGVESKCRCVGVHLPKRSCPGVEHPLKLVFLLSFTWSHVHVDCYGTSQDSACQYRERV